MKISHFAVAGLVSVGLSHATVHFPFPQNLDYGNANAATLTDKATAATQLQTAFDYYYTTFYRENGDYACIRADPGDNQCFSEGIGYGMLMMVYFSNNEKNYQTEFDKLWALYKAAEDKYGLMNWKIGNADPTQVWGEYAATDAEVDVAAALIMASYQFGDATYLSEAKTLLQNVRTYEFETNGLHKPGDNWNDKKNPSYISPAYYYLFAAVDTDGAEFWNTTAMDANYALLEANSASHTTGLFDNWTNASGADLESMYGYDASRTPWRLGQAWYWFSDSRAQALLQKMGTWASTQSASNVAGSISVSGTMGADHNNTFVATVMTSLSASTAFQSKLDEYWNEAVSTTNSDANLKYFQKSMEILNGLLVSGNMPNFASGALPVSISKAPKALSSAVVMQGKQLNLKVSGAAQVKLFNLTGHEVWNTHVAAGTSTVSLSKIPNGVYMVQIRSGEKSEMHKIRVQ